MSGLAEARAAYEAQRAMATWRRVRDVMGRFDGWKPEDPAIRVGFAYLHEHDRHIVEVGTIRYYLDGDPPETADVIEVFPDGTRYRHGGGVTI
jgi:hypothetical protein